MSDPTKMISGRYELGMPNGDYRAYPALNYSHLKLMYKPALYKQMVLDGKKKEQSHSMSIGTAVHTMILEPHLEKSVRKLSDYGHTDRRKHAAIKQLQFDNPGDQFFLDSELEQIETMVANIKDHPIATTLYSGNIHNEVSAFWHDHEYDFACKGRFDTINFDEGYVVDLKTTKDAEGFMKECVNFGYHIQAAFYLKGVKELTGKDFDWYWVAVDTASPFDVYVYKMTAQTGKIGAMQVDEYMSTLKECMATGIWPNGNEGLKEGELPGWYTSRFIKKVEGEYNEFRAT